MRIRTVVTLTFESDRELAPEDVARDVPGATLVEASAQATRIGVAAAAWPTRLVLAESRGGDNYLLPEGVAVRDLDRADGFEGFPQIGGEEPSDAALKAVDDMLKLILTHGVATRIEAFTTDNPCVDEYETEANVCYRITRYHGFCLAEKGVEISVDEINGSAPWVGYAFVTVAVPPEIARQLLEIERTVPEVG